MGLAETAYAPGQFLPKHIHECGSLIVVLRGSFVETYGGKARSCEASGVIFRPAGEDHANRFHDAAARCLNVQFAQSWLRRLDGVRLPQTSVDFARGALPWLGVRLAREFRARDEAAPLAVEGLALEMIAEIARASRRRERRPPRWLSRVRDCVHARFAERLTVAELAREAGVHPVHLNRAFRGAYRATVGEYVRALRVEAARERIASTDLPLSRVACEAGFYDQSHFSRTFKRLVGASPSEYRKLLRRG